jgi:hypothetical protein
LCMMHLLLDKLCSPVSCGIEFTSCVFNANAILDVSRLSVYSNTVQYTTSWILYWGYWWSSR